MRTFTAYDVAQSLGDFIRSFNTTEAEYAEEAVNHVVDTLPQAASWRDGKPDRLYLTLDNGAVYEVSIVKIKSEEV